MKGFIMKTAADKNHWRDLNKENSYFNPALFNFNGENSLNGYENRRIFVLKFTDYKLQLQQ